MLDDSPAASPAYLAAYVAANSAVTAPTAQAGATVYALPAGPQ